MTHRCGALAPKSRVVVDKNKYLKHDFPKRLSGGEAAIEYVFIVRIFEIPTKNIFQPIHLTPILCTQGNVKI